ncbi:alpha/beta fold hydrolase [Streptomyces sp. ODS05-4]|uniref:alpha/beta fold hydrolase n=1 Tax=Streptomyces sp. ODS05-4 TaxID=2944939 RepID=UPI00210E342D|nr:alpha/beta hydrolase [Streptomyces sp. ODS05-4]
MNSTQAERATTRFLRLAAGELAYDVTGEGRLVVLAHGMGDNRRVFAGLRSLLVAAGYRVVTTDLRGHGESSAGWPSYSRSDSAADLVALIRHLGGPAVIVGHSFAGGAATIAAADAPDLVDAVVEISPFTRAQKIDFAGLGSNGRYRKGMLLLMGAGMLRSVGLWMRYLDHAYPGVKPQAYAAHVRVLEDDLRRKGRMAVVARMGMAAPTDAGARLGEVRCPALIIGGDLDPDWVDPGAEATAVAAAMPSGVARVEMVEGAGHYAHAQYPDRVAVAVTGFLRQVARG